MKKNSYCATAPAATNPLSDNGMVVTPHYLASQAGLAILRKGGNALDAAIAASAMLSVVYPHMCGVGGDAFWLVYDAKNNKLQALNASGHAASGASTAMYEARGFKAVPARGYLAANTAPCAVAGWGKVHEYSRQVLGSSISWASLLDDAIVCAGQGFAIGHSLATWLRLDTSGNGPGRGLHQYPEFFALFCHEDGRPYGLGERLRQPGLENTLRRLADNGFDEFYHGKIGREIADSMMLHAGFLTVGDMHDEHADWCEPVSTNYRDTVFYSSPPNSQGLTACQILGIVDQFDLASLGEGSARHYHLLAEAVAIALADRNRHLADPDHGSDEVRAKVRAAQARLLDRDYLKSAATGLDLAKCRAAKAQTSAGGDTVWVGVVDKDGNAVSMLQSLYHEFGSGMVAGETGIILHNRGMSFSLDESHPNCLEPGKRPMHTLTPAMLFKNGKPWLVFGSMGGDGQPQTLAQLASRIVDFGLSPQEAVNAPRFLLGKSWGAEDESLKLEGRIAASVAEELRGMGHQVSQVQDHTEIMGHAGAILCHENGFFQGGADLRGDGSVACW